jgi:D-alanyl-D-alanine carboxypeptidase/D-alanyl-D-alanine-endopeptidase (penicillin-binding protein 4)
VSPKFKIKIVSYKDFILNDDNTSFSFYSSPISLHLKQMNIYSNNFYADKIFNYMGGVNQFHNFIDSSLNTTKDEIKFETGSGLGENYTTCEVTIRMLEELAQTLFTYNLKHEQIMSVPGTDQGTLKDRFKEKEYNQYLVAKTGTLRHTSTLAGFIFHHDPILFGLFNHTYQTTKARDIQNAFIKEAIKSFSGTRSIDYKVKEYISLSFSRIE